MKPSFHLETLDSLKHHLDYNLHQSYVCCSLSLQRRLKLSPRARRQGGYQRPVGQLLSPWTVSSLLPLSPSPTLSLSPSSRARFTELSSRGTQQESCGHHSESPSQTNRSLYTFIITVVYSRTSLIWTPGDHQKIISFPQEMTSPMRSHWQLTDKSSSWSSRPQATKTSVSATSDGAPSGREGALHHHYITGNYQVNQTWIFLL